MIRKLFCFLSLLVTISCGTRDYEDEVTEDEPVYEGKIQTWRERALQHKHERSEVFIGNYTRSINPTFSTLETSADCPAETLCIKSPYFGEFQLAHLMNDHPALFRHNSDGTHRTYTITPIPRVQVETDFFEIPSKMSLNFCGDSIEIIASEVSGRGILDSSAAPCSKRNAGSISIFAPVINGLQIKANGIDGEDGKDGKDNFSLQARNGTTENIRLEAKPIKQKIRICINVFGCIDEIAQFTNENKSLGVGAWTAYFEKKGKWFDSVGFSYATIESTVKSFEEQYTASQEVPIHSLECYFTSDPSWGWSGLATHWERKISGLEEIHGQDARSYSLGESGADGGNSGKIILVGKDISLRSLEHKAGKAGKVGKSYIQRPGKGAEVKSSKLTASYKFSGKVTCEGPEYYWRQDSKTKKTWTYRMVEKYHRDFRQPISKTFEIPQSKRSGRNGKPLRLKPSTSGKPGKEKLPEIVETSSTEYLTTRIHDACPSCQVPTALEELWLH